MHDKKEDKCMINVTVVIPNYNGLNFLPECLESLNHQKYPLEVIIVDNGSHDGSVNYIKENHGQFTLIENQENLGFSVAVNQGINASNTEYVFLMNNDVELKQNCILNLVKCIGKDEDIFAVSSKMIQYHDRNVLDDAGDEYTILGWSRKRGDGKSSDLYNNEEEVFSACAGAALYRKTIFKEIGYFDEAFFAYLEDVDIGYRARIYGYRNVYCPQAVAYHLTSATTGSRYNEFKISLSARNNVYVPYKNMPWPQYALNFVFLLAGYFIKYIFFIRRGQGKSYLKGLMEGFTSLDRINKIDYQSKNLENYIIIEWLLIKNTFKFLNI